MDSKALLAIVLSFLLFLAWHFYFAPKHASPTPGKTGRHHYDSTPSARRPRPCFHRRSPPKVDFSTQKTWSIGDSLFRMKVIAQGARESSFELLKFKEELKPDSPPMQLIRDTAYLPLDVELIFHKDWNLYRTAFYERCAQRYQDCPGRTPQKHSIPNRDPRQSSPDKDFHGARRFLRYGSGNSDSEPFGRKTFRPDGTQLLFQAIFRFCASNL